MTQNAHTPQVGWGRTAGYGAEAGIALAFGYALAFIGYAVGRSTLTILTPPTPDGTLAGTLLATWASLAVPAFVLAAIFGILAAVSGALTALVLRALVSRVNPTHAPRRAIGMGLAVCLSVSLALLVLLYQGLGVRWMPATAATLTFWLLVPLLIYVVAGGVASWHINRKLAV
jgi:hypothetical protein